MFKPYQMRPEFIIAFAVLAITAFAADITTKGKTNGTDPAVVLCASAQQDSSGQISQQADTEIVTFNVKSHKFHCPACGWAKHCTKSCIEITRQEAISRGGVPCKICGGKCK